MLYNLQRCYIIPLCNMLYNNLCYMTHPSVIYHPLLYSCLIMLYNTSPSVLYSTQLYKNPTSNIAPPPSFYVFWGPGHTYITPVGTT